MKPKKISKNKNEQLEKEIYKTHYKYIHNVIFKIVKNIELAEELANDSFIQAFKSFDTFKKNISLKAWLKTIATNKTFDYLRKKSSTDQRNQIEIDDYILNKGNCEEKNIEHNLIQAEDSLLMQKALKKLFYKYRNILTKRYYEEMSYKDLARYYEVDVGSIKSTLNKAHKALRESYKQILTNEC